MNTNELILYVKNLPEEVKSKFVKKEFKNKKLSMSEDIEYFFSKSKTVAEVKEFFSKFDNEAIVNISAESYPGYDEEKNYNVELSAEVVLMRLETDDELTGRILYKIADIEANRTKKKKKS